MDRAIGLFNTRHSSIIHLLLSLPSARLAMGLHTKYPSSYVSYQPVAVLMFKLLVSSLLSCSFRLCLSTSASFDLCTERKSEMNCTGAKLGSVTCGHGCAAED